MSDYNYRDHRQRVTGARLLPGALAVALASAALVVIGTLEASESARQLGEVAARPVLRPEGIGLSALGFAASALVYLALGWWLADDGAALRVGAVTGVTAGLVGGAIRAALIAEPVRGIVGRYAALPEWFIPAVLAVFVGFEVLASGIGGSALAFAGVRVRRVTRARGREG